MKIDFGVGAALLTSSLSAAFGQVLLKLAADGRDRASAFLNPYLALGLALYALGMVAWIFALSRLPLSTVYPFTAVTLVLVGALSMFLLGERTTPLAACGWLTIIAGVGLVWFGARG